MERTLWVTELFSIKCWVSFVDLEKRRHLWRSKAMSNAEVSEKARLLCPGIMTEYELFTAILITFH